MINAEAPIEIRHGIPEALRSCAVSLYEDAFGPMFAVAIPSAANRSELLASSLNLEFAFCAIKDRRLVGLAGYKTENGSFTDGMTYHRLLKHTGLLRGNWAALVFSFYERALSPGELLMDGIVVDASMRGSGIGARLLNELSEFARSNGYVSVRLDVVDTNPGARRMYERNGFRATRTEKFGYLRGFFGFGASTTLVRDLGDDG